MRLQERSTIIRVGSAFLLFGGLAKLFLSRATGLGDGVADGMVGVCYGIAIGCLLLTLRRGKRAV